MGGRPRLERRNHFIVFPLPPVSAAAVPNPLFLPETPNPCTSCAAWNQPHPPVHVFGNTWWVGVEGLSAVAVDTGAGLILLDGGLPQE